MKYEYEDEEEDQLIEVVRDTVQQLERMTKRLQSFIDNNEGIGQ